MHQDGAKAHFRRTSTSVDSKGFCIASDSGRAKKEKAGASSRSPNVVFYETKYRSPNVVSYETKYTTVREEIKENFSGPSAVRFATLHFGPCKIPPANMQGIRKIDGGCYWQSEIPGIEEVEEAGRVLDGAGVCVEAKKL